jgi:hypothetical protein
MISWTTCHKFHFFSPLTFSPIFTKEIALIFFDFVFTENCAFIFYLLFSFRHLFTNFKYVTARRYKTGYSVTRHEKTCIGFWAEKNDQTSLFSRKSVHVFVYFSGLFSKFQEQAAAERGTSQPSTALPEHWILCKTAKI